MLNIYKIIDVDWSDQTLEDIEENGGQLWCITIKTDINNNIMQDVYSEDDDYEGGWPIGFSFSEEWGFRQYELYPELYSEYSPTSKSNVVTRQLYVITPNNIKPIKGDYCAFLNQFDKRIDNEEIIDILQNLQGETDDIISYEIGKDNKLHRI